MGADVAHCVECYSGYTYAEYPRAFICQDRKLRVTKIDSLGVSVVGGNCGGRFGAKRQNDPHIYSLPRKFPMTPKILNRWQIPSGYLFRVIGSDDGCYELEYQVLPDCWQVRPF